MLAQLNAFPGEEHRSFYWNGGKAAALLIHGFPGTPAEMRPLAGLLHGQGWTVQGPLLPGFGPDIATLGERSAGEWVAAVRSALSDLSARHDPVLLVGHSLGGALAIQAAAAASQPPAVRPPSGLILVSPFWKLVGGGPIRYVWPLIRRLFPEIRPFRLFKPDLDDPRVREGMNKFLPGIDLDDADVRRTIRDFAVPTRLVDQVVATGAGGYAAAPLVHAPVLVLQGRGDRTVRPELTSELVQRLAGQVSYHETAGAHDLNLPDGAGWPDVSRLVLDFAATLTPPLSPQS